MNIQKILAATQAVLAEAKRGTPALLDLVNQVRLAANAAGALAPEAEAAFQDARGVFGAFQSSNPLTALPVAAAPAQSPAAEQPATPAPAPEVEPLAAAAPVANN